MVLINNILTIAITLEPLSSQQVLSKQPPHLSLLSYGPLLRNIVDDHSYSALNGCAVTMPLLCIGQHLLIYHPTLYHRLIVRVTIAKIVLASKLLESTDKAVGCIPYGKPTGRDVDMPL